MNTKYIFDSLKFLSLLFLIFIMITGSDCENLINNNVVPQEILGNWKLIEQTGALQDICPNETVFFEASGNATLTCPNSNSIVRNYTVSNSILTYSQSGVSYSLSFPGSDTLLMNGQNVSRSLLYVKLLTGRVFISNANESRSINSSEEGN